MKPDAAQWSELDDFALLHRWREGDAPAGNALFERHFDGVYRFFCNKAGDEAADLVQRTFLGCVEARDRFREDSGFRTFLFSIARHELYGFWRARGRGEALDSSTTSIADLDPSPSAIIARGQSERLLLEALRSMPLELQIALELHYWEDVDGSELAAILDIPEGTVRSKLRRATEALRQKIAELDSSAPLDATDTDLAGWAASLRELRDVISAG